ncbi:1-acyl-sn-glycerol-3-phosphate acyltransferase [Lactobacillus sp. PV037]|uniref:1-acyl-sn-glycerol-3-phosphate acyltransferase n=1 Tax=Lactobacillus sp. PV037 TaxID=2594496 RepID=UPI00223EC4E0|nr:1-acyl-sn-glycerol-3-phosphate acyltransferase [Lactobacillus sp. PV037]QNQ84281.1 1-acyl-sn-glycerol-3-phosphate acyltransferase [Lactobacillus sp. PV037]
MKKFYYHTLADDLVKSKKQNFKLSDNYQIINQKFPNGLVRTLAKDFAALLTYGYLRVKIVGRQKLVPYQNQGYFVFANHTQPMNDAFMPILLFGKKQYYAIADQANWGIPILGKHILPYGALPVGNDLKQSIKLINAIKKLIKTGNHIVIYPEAHVWPYYTQIRPFPETSMNFPVSLKAPSFVMTTTYQAPKHGKKPQIIVYIDGPFLPDTSLPKKVQQAKLHDEIYQVMQKRAKSSNYQYYHYQKVN